MLDPLTSAYCKYCGVILFCVDTPYRGCLWIGAMRGQGGLLIHNICKKYFTSHGLLSTLQDCMRGYSDFLNNNNNPEFENFSLLV